MTWIFSYVSNFMKTKIENFIEVTGSGKFGRITAINFREDGLFKIQKNYHQKWNKVEKNRAKK